MNKKQWEKLKKKNAQYKRVIQKLLARGKKLANINKIVTILPRYGKQVTCLKCKRPLGQGGRSFIKVRDNLGKVYYSCCEKEVKPPIVAPERKVPKRRKVKKVINECPRCKKDKWKTVEKGKVYQCKICGFEGIGINKVKEN